MSAKIAIVTAHNSYFITKLVTINNSVMSTHKLNRPNYYSLYRHKTIQNFVVYQLHSQPFHSHRLTEPDAANCSRLASHFPS